MAIPAPAVLKRSLDVKDRRGPGLTWSDLWQNRPVKQKPKVVLVVVVVVVVVVSRMSDERIPKRMLYMANFLTPKAKRHADGLRRSAKKVQRPASCERENLQY